MVGDEGLGIGGFRAKVPVVEEVNFGRVFLIALQFRVVYGVETWIEWHDFQAPGVRHVLIQRVVGGRLRRIDSPQLFKLGQCVPEPVAHGGLQGKAHRRGFDGGFIGVLTKGAIAQGGHQRQLIQVERTVRRVRGQHGAQGSQRAHFQYGVF
ncbi:hypothetical protein D3C72_1917960 [compost metagenome]